MATQVNPGEMGANMATIEELTDPKNAGQARCRICGEFGEHACKRAIVWYDEAERLRNLLIESTMELESANDAIDNLEVWP